MKAILTYNKTGKVITKKIKEINFNCDSERIGILFENDSFMFIDKEDRINVQVLVD